MILLPLWIPAFAGTTGPRCWPAALVLALVQDGELAAGRGFGDFNAGGEGVFQLFDVGDYEDQVELVFDGFYGFYEPLSALGVLRAESFVDDERLQTSTRPPCKQS